MSPIDALGIGHGAKLRLSGVYSQHAGGTRRVPVTATLLLGFTADGMDVAHMGSLLHLPADTVVLSIGSVPRRDVAEVLEALWLEYHAIGDCPKSGDALYALREGADVEEPVAGSPPRATERPP